MIRTSVTIDKSSFELNPAFYDVENATLARNHFYGDVEVDALVNLFAQDVKTFSRKAKVYASSVVINSLARRNASSVQIFHDRISLCGEIGKQICKDLLQAMRHVCQSSGKHEQLGKSFFVVRKDQKTKSLHFSFSEVKNNIWNNCLKEAKKNRASLLYYRLESPSVAPKTYLDRLVQIAESYDRARARAAEGKESSAEGLRLEAFNKQLSRLPEALRQEVKNALRVLSSLELPN